MPTTLSKGNAYGLYIHDGVAFVLVGAMRQHTFDRTREMIDKLNKDAPDDAVYEAGQRSASLTISGLYSYDDAGQVEIKDQYNTDTSSRQFELRGPTGGPKWTFNAWVESLSISAPLNDMSVIDVTLRVDGAITEGTA